MRDTQNTSITHRDLAPDRCEKRSRGIWQRVDTATRYRACRCGTLRAEWQCNRYAQGQVAVHFTLPLGIERVDAVRSGSSGSATGTLRGKWQCTSHCHSMVNVRDQYAQGRVAVQLVRSGSSGSATGTLRVEWQCGSRQPVRSGPSGSAGRDGPKLVSATSASGCALSEAGPKPYRERPLREGESLCNWVDATGWPFCRLQLGGLFAGWMVPFFTGWTVLWPVRLICSTCP